MEELGHNNDSTTSLVKVYRMLDTSTKNKIKDTIKGISIDFQRAKLSVVEITSGRDPKLKDHDRINFFTVVTTNEEGTNDQDSLIVYVGNQELTSRTYSFIKDNSGNIINTYGSLPTTWSWSQLINCSKYIQSLAISEAPSVDEIRAMRSRMRSRCEVRYKESDRIHNVDKSGYLLKSDKYIKKLISNKMRLGHDTILQDAISAYHRSCDKYIQLLHDYNPVHDISDNVSRTIDLINKDYLKVVKDVKVLNGVISTYKQLDKTSNTTKDQLARVNRSIRTNAIRVRKNSNVLSSKIDDANKFVRHNAEQAEILLNIDSYVWNTELLSNSVTEGMRLLNESSQLIEEVK